MPSRSAVVYAVLTVAASGALLLLQLAPAHAAGMATILWASDPAAPGETVMVTGARFTPESQVELAAVPRRNAGTPLPGRQPEAGPWTRIKPLQTGSESIKFLLPADAPESLYYCRVAGGANSVVLNLPHVFWTQADGTDPVPPGGRVRVFGVCLDFDNQAQLGLMSGQGKFVPLEMSGQGSRTPYALAGTIPAGTAPGLYTIYAHNGLGGVGGWVAAGRISVGTPIAPWIGPTYKVTDYGAVANDGKDQTEAFQKAIAAAGATGGTVLVPRGRYLITGTLKIPPRVRLAGEATALCELYWPDRKDPLPKLIVGTNRFAIEDLTLACRNFNQGISADLGSVAGSGHITLNRVRIRFSQYLHVREAPETDRRFRAVNPQAIHLGGSNIRITDCDVLSSGMSFMFSQMRSSYVAHNKFYNGRMGWYCLAGSDGLIFEDNEIAACDLQGNSGGINCLDGSTSSQNVYFARNRLHHIFGCDREAMTSDAGGGAYLGKIASARGATVVLAADADWQKRSWAGACLFILDGTGAGQYRRIKSAEGRTVNLDRPWTIAPDAKSLVSITMLQRHYLVVGNDFCDDTIAVQYYGVSIEHVTADNRCARGGGYHAMGMNYYGWQPSWFQRFLNNRITEGNGLNGPLNEVVPLDSHVALLGSNPPNAGPMNRGGIIRGNLLENNANIEINHSWRDVLVEGNTIRHADRGIIVQKGARDVLLRKNVMEDIAKPLSGEGAPKEQAD